jgi:hypothetical protein
LGLVTLIFLDANFISDFAIASILVSIPERKPILQNRKGYEEPSNRDLIQKIANLNWGK